MEDPLLRYSPFRDHSSLYIRHAHEVLISFIVYHMLVYPILAPVVNRIVFRRYYRDATKAVKLNFDVHTASMFQAVVCLALSFPLLWLPVGLDLFGYANEYASMVSAVTLGYFLWDLYLCVKYFRLFGLGFLVHAIGSVVVIGLSLMPSFQAWIGKFLIFEMSTPFVNVNWYIAQLTRKTSSRPVVPAWVNVLNGILLLLTFFLVRILWGTIALAILDYQVWKQWDVDTPVVVALLVPTINWLMTVLNYYWFSKMVRIARKMANASKKVSKVA